MLSAYETGKQRPSFATLDKILAALDSDARDLTTALLAPEQSSGEPDFAAASAEARGRANLDAITALELEIRTLVDEMGNDWTKEERSILSRSGLALAWLLRHLKKED